MKPMFDVVESENEDGTRDVVFAFDSDIDAGEITHVSFVADNVHEALQDNGTSCEDYVINTPLTEDEVTRIVEGLGYVKNEEIRDLMWC